MKLISYVKMFFSGRAFVLSLVMLSSTVFFRFIFIAAGLESGIYKRLAGGRADLDDLAEVLGPEIDRDKLAAWLRLGVKLREIGLNRRGYYLRGLVSKNVVKPKHDAAAALLSELAYLYHGIVIKTPEMLKQNKEFDEWAEYGELIARSSRVFEDIIFPFLDDVIPRSGDFSMLEVGCGSGIYMRYACNRNPNLTAVGLEVQEDVAHLAEKNIQTWQVQNQATVQAVNVLDYKSEYLFDLVTLHNNNYYFPLETRVDLARHLLTFLKPGGRLIITSACQGGSVGTEYMNLFCVMSKGSGPLPYPDQLESQLIEAGFETVKLINIIPKAIDSAYMFIAGKSA